VTQDVRSQLQQTLGASYSIERELGGGGMSRVFLAEETALGRKVVVKVLPPDLAASVNVERFRREIQLAARLQHPHIVAVHAAGISEGLPYYTMPYIEGESLRARIARAGAMPIVDTVRILAEVLSALDYAHEHGIVHRDIKPENILLSGHHAVVADFGVAKALSVATNAGTGITSVGVAIGTPAYMAPEQAAADPTVDHRADLYAVGAVAYEMLTGQPVFSPRSAQALLAAHATEAPEPVTKRRGSVPPALADTVMRALEKNVADRPQSAAEMLAAVEASATPAGTDHWSGASQGKTLRRNDKRGTAIAMALAVVLLLLASSSWYWYGHRATTGSVDSGVPPSLAVLPFENLGKPDDAYFADGMTEEISTRLGQLTGIRVIGRQSSRSYAGTSKSIPEIGKELGVGYILTGSVRWDRSDPTRNRVRISPALLRASDGSQVWSAPYEDSPTKVFALQSNVAERVAQAMSVELRPKEHTALGARPTTSLDAYDYYLRAQAIMLSRGLPGAREAAPLFERATELDPAFALAFASLGRAKLRQVAYEGVDSAKIKQAKAAIDSSLTLSPDLSAGHLALGYYHYRIDEDYARALAEYRLADSLSPNQVEVLLLKADLERRLGKPLEAVNDTRVAAQLDPLNAEALTGLAWGLNWIGKYDAADSAARRVIALDSANSDGYSLMQVTALNRGDEQRSLSILRTAITKLDPGDIGDFLLGSPFPAVRDPQLVALMHKAKPGRSPRERAYHYFGLANLFWYEGNRPEQIRAADSVLYFVAQAYTGKSYRDEVASFTAFAYALKGDRKRAIDIAEEAVNRTSAMDAVALSNNLFLLGFTAALVGDSDKAIAVFQKALAAPAATSAAQLRLDPQLASLRSDPRWKKLMGIK
jgi:eukaryotic-like serine/threonine-protein kinase